MNAIERPTLLALTRYFVELGTTGFGGPVALVGYMQRDLVERRRWFTEEEFSEGLAVSQISPGPLAAQLAMYLGWLQGGVTGATLVSVAFVAPPFIMVIALSVLYVRTGEISWLRDAFLGIGAGVVCILGRSALKLGHAMLQRDRFLWGIAALNAAGVLVFQRESMLLLMMSGLALLVARSVHKPAPALMIAPVWMLLATAALTSFPPVVELFLYFAQAGAAVFGSGLAIIPFLYAGVVEQRHWLTEPQFLDAIAVSMVTPGPVVITATFIGYLVAGFAGGVSAALGVFLPAYLIVLIVAPRFATVVRNPRIRLFTTGITAATTGAIAGAAALLSVRMVTDLRTLAIAALVLLAMLTRVRVPEPLLIVFAGCLGVLIA